MRALGYGFRPHMSQNTFKYKFDKKNGPGSLGCGYLDEDKGVAVWRGGTHTIVPVFRLFRLFRNFCVPVSILFHL